MNRTPPSGRPIGSPFIRPQRRDTFIDNERRLLDLVRRDGPISRAEMARRTDLAMQSVVRLVDGLIERGFLRSGEKVIRGRGQPSLPIELAEQAAFTIGASVLNDAVSLVLMNLAGQVVASHKEGMDVTSRAAVVDYLKRKIAEVANDAGIDRSRLFGIGAATSGYFVDAARLNTPSFMGEWALRDLEADLATALELPVWMENDGNAAAVGESLFGVGVRHRSFAYIYLGAGLGGGLISDGVPMRGFRGNAGEFTGLLPVEARPDRPTLSSLLEMLRANGIALASMDEMVTRFDPSWPGVQAWLERTQPATTAILSAIAAVSDPEVIVIGGRAPPALSALIAERAEYYTATLRDRERPFPAVLAAEARGDAAALGAASIPLKEHFFV